MKPPLFWSDIYCRLNSQSKESIFYQSGHLEHRLDFIFVKSGDVMSSPGKATFGGLWATESNVLAQVYVDAVNSIFGESPLTREISIILPPRYFFPEVFDNQSTALESIGFELIYTDFNFHIDVLNWSASQMSKGNRKKVRQFLEHGGEVVEATSTEHQVAFDLLKQNRKSRGAVLSMSKEVFLQNLTELPNIYKVYIAKMNETVTAVAYTVKICSEVNYVLFWGDDLEFRHFSPVASILCFLMEIAKKHGYQYLDLGISSITGSLDVNLARFKSNLGAVATLKPVYRKFPESSS